MISAPNYDHQLRISETRVLKAIKRSTRKLKRILRPTYLTWLERSSRKSRYSIKPKQIRTISKTVFPDSLKIAVVDGNWDDSQDLFEDSTWHQACCAVYSDGQDWSETRFYQDEKAAIVGRQSIRKYATEKDLDVWLAEFDARFRRTREYGQLAVTAAGPPITVNVGRDGDLLLNDGMDNLSIALLLGIPLIPAEVRVRHVKWMDFRRELCCDARGAYAPLLHPDLEWMPGRRTGNDRFELMKRSLVETEGRLLDIGSYWGYFCQRFEEIGFDCIAVEKDPRNVYFLEKLKRANNNKFESVNQSVFDYIGDQPKEFNVVLAMAVFHWLIRTKEKHDLLIKMLRNIRTQELFFIPHHPSEINMSDAYWNPGEDEFAEFVMKHTGLRSSSRLEQLGSGDSNRCLYHMTA